MQTLQTHDGSRKRRATFAVAGIFVLALVARLIATFNKSVLAQQQRHHLGEKFDRNHPWMNPKLSPDERAAMVLKEITLDEKIDLLHGMGMPNWPRDVQNPQPEFGNSGAGFVLGIPRLGIPYIQMSDAAYGVRASGENGRYSTALPANVGAAASWDPEAACSYGRLIGKELRAQGYNMTLGGGTNITREPRNGRTFEYLGEDPILAGTLVGNLMKCEQAEHVLGDIKHYAVNDQENGRNEVDVLIGKRAMRESDLLAFEIGVGIADPAAVMCSYNAVNGDFACENKYLLTDVLKKEWGFKGFVVSDWGGTHSTVKASAAGLDNEEPLDEFFGAKMKEAVEAGKVSQAELDEHVRRILRSEFAAGIVDYPYPEKRPRHSRWSRNGPKNRRIQCGSPEKRKRYLAVESVVAEIDRDHRPARRRRNDFRRRLRPGRCARSPQCRLAGARLVPDVADEGRHGESAERRREIRVGRKYRSRSRTREKIRRRHRLRLLLDGRRHGSRNAHAA